MRYFVVPTDRLSTSVLLRATDLIFVATREIIRGVFRGSLRLSCHLKRKENFSINIEGEKNDKCYGNV